MADCMVGFAQVPAELLEAPVKAGRDDDGRQRIPVLAVLLWAVLDVHQRDNGSAWPSYAHLAEHLGCARRAVMRAADQLEAAGWLTRERGGGRGKATRYVLLRRPGVVHSGDLEVTVSDGKGDLEVTKTVTSRSPRTIDREPEGRGTQEPTVTTARAKPLHQLRAELKADPLGARAIAEARRVEGGGASEALIVERAAELLDTHRVQWFDDRQSRRPA